MTRATVFTPLLSTILRDRKLSLAILMVSSLQFVLGLARFSGWPCPFFHALGIPCPGCGLTRATFFLFGGEWKRAMILHAFAPFFVVALIVIGFCTIVPRRHTQRIVAATELVERYTGITAILLLGLIVYWLARLLIMPAAFVRMIQG